MRLADRGRSVFFLTLVRAILIVVDVVVKDVEDKIVSVSMNSKARSKEDRHRDRSTVHNLRAILRVVLNSLRTPLFACPPSQPCLVYFYKKYTYDEAAG